MLDDTEYARHVRGIYKKPDFPQVFHMGLGETRTIVYNNIRVSKIIERACLDKSKKRGYHEHNAGLYGK